MIVKLAMFVLGLWIGLNIIDNTNKNIRSSDEEIIKTQDTTIKTQDTIIKNQETLIKLSEGSMEILTCIVKKHESRIQDLIELIKNYELGMKATLEENIILKRKISQYEK